MDFNKGAPTPSGPDTKTAHNRFVSTFSGTNINSLYDSFTKIQEYNSKDDDLIYPVASISEDIIKSDFEELKQSIHSIEDLVSNNGDKENIKLVAESIDDQIFVIDHKLSKLEEVVKEMFNVIIFNNSGKLGIAYQTDDYIPSLKVKLNILKSIIGGLNAEIQKAAPDFNSINFNEFMQADFTIDNSKVDSFTKEYSTFVNEAKKVRSGYANLATFATSLRSQINSIGFGNVLLEDGFCDLEEHLLDAMLSDAIKVKFTEWGGQYNSKKDWMHFGINNQSFEEYLLD